jgi:hypothetical protein
VLKKQQKLPLPCGNSSNSLLNARHELCAV